MRRGLLTILLGGVALVAAPAAQQSARPAAPPPSRAPGTADGGQQPAPPVTFRVEIDYVEVDAVVTDERGNLVQGLTQDDFEVYEDGKLQQVTIFNQVVIPVERLERVVTENRPVIPDVKSNARPFDGRLYVIVLDDYHTAALRSTLVKRAAKQFIDKYLGANDIAAVIHTSGRMDASQEFTSDPRLLNAAVDKFMGQKLRSRTLERLDEYNRQRNTIPTDTGSGDGSGSTNGTGRDRKVLDPLDIQRGYYARNTLGTLRSLSDFMSGIHGRRKAILFFSEGIDYPIYDVFDSRDATTIVQETRDAITAAARANVNFYTIDPRGLHSMGDEIMDMGAPPEDPSFRINNEGLQDERRLAVDSLKTLAEQTGGRAVVESNDYARAYDRIVQENSTYYVLGYYPPSDKRDGRFHKIEVKVKRPGLKVTSRKGYAAPKGKPEKTEVDPSAGTSTALRELLNSPLQQSGLTLSVAAAPFAGTKDNVAITVEIVGRNLKFAQSEKGLFTNTVEVSMLPLEARGKAQQGRRSEVKLNLRPQTAQMMQATAVRLAPRLSLPPGRYQLRVAARETGGGLTGSVFYDLEVPDFTKQKFAMSGLVLTAATAQVTPTAEADPVLKPLLPGPPTTRREFYDIDTVALYAEIYDNLESKVPHTVDITGRLLSEDGREVARRVEERSSKDIAAKGGGFGYSAQFPLTDVAPGRYVLRVEAKARLKDAPTVMREMLVTVVPTPAELKAEPKKGSPGE